MIDSFLPHFVLPNIAADVLTNLQPSELHRVALNRAASGCRNVFIHDNMHLNNDECALKRDVFKSLSPTVLIREDLGRNVIF